jgi:GNAT superfamily N-acetyltransferase
VGVAPYVRDHERCDSADIAVSVLETRQGRGVGKAVLQRLADLARAEGISRFTALMLADNWRMRRLLANLGEPVVLATAAGTVELAVDLHHAVPSVDADDARAALEPGRLPGLF